MPKPFSLKTVLDLSHARLDDAARQLGRLMANERASSDTLALLIRYRDDYLARFLEIARDGISPDRMRNYQAFVGRLDDAIAQQRTTLNDSQQRTASGQKAWVTHRNRARALDTLSQRHLAHERRQEEQREQKRSDENAMNLYRANRE